MGLNQGYSVLDDQMVSLQVLAPSSMDFVVALLFGVFCLFVSFHLYITAFEGLRGALAA